MESAFSSPDLNLNGHQHPGQRLPLSLAAERFPGFTISTRCELRALGMLEQSCSCFECTFLTEVTSQVSLKDVTNYPEDMVVLIATNFCFCL